MLRSLICQLSQHSVISPEALNKTYTSCGKGQQQPSDDKLLEMLKSLLEGFTQVFVVLDALDECALRDELLETIQELVGWQFQHIHIIMTSRREQAIDDSLSGFIGQQNIIHLENELVDQDIRKYVRQRLREDRYFTRYNSETIILIENTLTSGAKGMSVQV